MTEDPFLLPDHRDYAEVLTDGAVHVLAVRGVAEFSVAAIARWMKVSPESINNVYSRARVIEVVTARFCRRWLRWTLSDYDWARTDPACPLRLPRSAEERHGCVVLQALGELARGERLRGNPLPAQRLAELRCEEAELLRSRLAELSPTQWVDPVTDDEVHALMAVLTGLRLLLATDPAPLTWEEASQSFARAVSAVVTRAPAGPTRPRDLPPPREPAA